jgi:hypothetical protein
VADMSGLLALANKDLKKQFPFNANYNVGGDQAKGFLNCGDPSCQNDKTKICHVVSGSEMKSNPCFACNENDGSFTGSGAFPIGTWPSVLHQSYSDTWDSVTCQNQVYSKQLDNYDLSQRNSLFATELFNKYAAVRKNNMKKVTSMGLPVEFASIKMKDPVTHEEIEVGLTYGHGTGIFTACGDFQLIKYQSVLQQPAQMRYLLVLQVSVRTWSFELTRVESEWLSPESYKGPADGGVSVQPEYFSVDYEWLMDRKNVPNGEFAWLKTPLR